MRRMMYETIFKSLGTGAAAAPCRQLVAPGRITDRRRTHSRRASYHPLCLAPQGATARRARGQATPRPRTAPDRRPTGPTRKPLAPRSQGPRLAQRPVDLPPHPPLDPPPLRRLLSSQSRRPLPPPPPPLALPNTPPPP